MAISYRLTVARMPRIEEMIFHIRGLRVMLDADLARIYGVTTKRLNEQFKRNTARFPSDFAFQINEEEFKIMRSQIATASKRNSRFRPRVFTEHGAIMLASVLNSKRAAEMSVFVVRAFVRMRDMFRGNRRLAAKLSELEKRVSGHDESIAELVETIRQLLNPIVEEPAKREMGFHIREQAPPYRIRRRS